MKRNSLLVILGILCFGIVFAAVFSRLPGESTVTFSKHAAPEKNRLFPYQCIDTMKVSRDKARLLANRPETQAVIANEVQTIASLGANCIAIGTPYDAEFLPYLKQWVAEARKADLAVWFRGNQSAWEGWFDYPENDSIDAHIAGNVRFITENPDLFRDGDIFSPNVEPENGGPFDPVDSADKEALMRSYLKKEQGEVARAFASINTSVTTSWISLSGGVAKAVLDDATVSALQNTVTLDHYVRTVDDMALYLDHFSKQFHARLVLGEFGAPIPDLNGDMTPEQQAAFVDELFQVLLLRKDTIDGVNYWTFSESSTALMDDQGVPKPVVEVIKKYYIPATVHLTVVDRSGEPLERISVSLNGQPTDIQTNAAGKATMVVPQGTHVLELTHPDGSILRHRFTARGYDSFNAQAKFVPQLRLLVPLFNFLQYF